MKVLMFGWEFPPYHSGGLGTACYGLTKGLSNHNVNVTFVLPKAKEVPDKTHVRIIAAEAFGNLFGGNIFGNMRGINIKRVDSLLVPYINSASYGKRYEKYACQFSNFQSSKDNIYGRNLYEEVHRYAQNAVLIAQKEDFDIIHCHDWMTYLAGIEAKKVSDRPFVIHVHATEFDRTGDNPTPYIYDIERKGMHAADHIMAVSQFTKNKIIEHYGIPPDKITVIHNAVEFNDNKFCEKINDNEKVVLFLGRITIQKGPDYFLYAAKRVLEYRKDVKFIVAGSGDMEGYIIEKAAEMGIADKVLFAGFLRGKDVDRVYAMADLYVMPSISEPFGITPLEAMRNNTPVLISRQSGVSEVLNHALKVDFWDIDLMANKILGVLNYPEVHQCLQENGSNELKKFSWDEPAEKCAGVYCKVIDNYAERTNAGGIT